MSASLILSFDRTSAVDLGGDSAGDPIQMQQIAAPHAQPPWESRSRQLKELDKIHTSTALKQCIAACLTAASGQKSLLIRDHADRLPLWRAAVSHAFPPEISMRISVSESVSEAGSESTDRHALASNQPIELDFTAGVQFLNKRRSVFAEVVAASVVAKDTELREFHQFLRELGISLPGREVEEACKLFLLVSNERDERLTDEDVLGALYFAERQSADAALPVLCAKFLPIVSSVSERLDQESVKPMVGFLLRCVSIIANPAIEQAAVSAYYRFLAGWMSRTRTWDEQQVTAIETTMQPYFSANPMVLVDFWCTEEAVHIWGARVREPKQLSLQLYVMRKLDEALRERGTTPYAWLQSAPQSMYAEMLAALGDLEVREAEAILSRALVRMADSWQERFDFFRMMCDLYPGENEELHPILVTFAHEMFAGLWEKQARDQLVREQMKELFRYLLELGKYSFLTRTMLALVRGKEGRDLFRFWARELRPLNLQYNRTQTEWFISKYLQTLAESESLKPDQYEAELAYVLEHYLDLMKPDQRTRDWLRQYEKQLSPLSEHAVDVMFLKQLRQYKAEHKISNLADRIGLTLVVHRLLASQSPNDSELMEIFDEAGDVNRSAFGDEEWTRSLQRLFALAMPHVTDSDTFASLFGMFAQEDESQAHALCMNEVSQLWLNQQRTQPLFAWFAYCASRVERLDGSKQRQHPFYLLWVQWLLELSAQQRQQLNEAIESTDWPEATHDVWQSVHAEVSRRKSSSLSGWLKNIFR